MVGSLAFLSATSKRLQNDLISFIAGVEDNPIVEMANHHSPRAPEAASSRLLLPSWTPPKQSLCNQTQRSVDSDPTAAPLLPNDLSGILAPSAPDIPAYGQVAQLRTSVSVERSTPHGADAVRGISTENDDAVDDMDVLVHSSPDPHADAGMDFNELFGVDPPAFEDNIHDQHEFTDLQTSKDLQFEREDPRLAHDDSDNSHPRTSEKGEDTFDINNVDPLLRDFTTVTQATVNPGLLHEQDPIAPSTARAARKRGRQTENDTNRDEGDQRQTAKRQKTTIISASTSSTTGNVTPTERSATTEAFPSTSTSQAQQSTTSMIHPQPTGNRPAVTTAAGATQATAIATAAPARAQRRNSRDLVHAGVDMSAWQGLEPRDLLYMVDQGMVDAKDVYGEYAYEMSKECTNEECAAAISKQIGKKCDANNFWQRVVNHLKRMVGSNDTSKNGRLRKAIDAFQDERISNGLKVSKGKRRKD